MVKRNKKIKAEESPNSKIVRQELDRKRKTDLFANESLEKKKKDIRNTEYEIDKELALNKKQKALQS